MLHTSALLPQIAIIAGLIVLSGVFSGVEAAFLSANRIRLRRLAEGGNERAARFMELSRRPDKVIATLLVGNNLVNILASALATSVALGMAERAALESAASVAVAAATGVMTFLILFFGEITPKSYCVANADRVSMRFAGVLRVLESLFWPVVAVLTWASSGLMRAVGVKRGKRSPFITEEDIKMLARVGEEEGTIERAERELIHGVFEFTDATAGEVMTPYEDVEAVASEATLLEALHLVNASGHSRLPVYRGKRGHVMGMVYAKDLLRYDDVALHRMRATEILRPLPIVRATDKVSRILKMMQRERHQIAIVQDARKHTVGLISVEDILEEMVGEILDEYDIEEQQELERAREAAAKARQGAQEPLAKRGKAAPGEQAGGSSGR